MSSDSIEEQSPFEKGMYAKLDGIIDDVSKEIQVYTVKKVLSTKNDPKLAEAAGEAALGVFKNAAKDIAVPCLKEQIDSVKERATSTFYAGRLFFACAVLCVVLLIYYFISWQSWAGWVALGAFLIGACSGIYALWNGASTLSIPVKAAVAAKCITSKSITFVDEKLPEIMMNAGQKAMESTTFSNIAAPAMQMVSSVMAPAPVTPVPVEPLLPTRAAQYQVTGQGYNYKPYGYATHMPHIMHSYGGAYGGVNWSDMAAKAKALQAKLPSAEQVAQAAQQAQQAVQTATQTAQALAAAAGPAASMIDNFAGAAGIHSNLAGAANQLNQAAQMVNSTVEATAAMASQLHQAGSDLHSAITGAVAQAVPSACAGIPIEELPSCIAKNASGASARLFQQ